MAARGSIAAIVHIFKFDVLFAGTVQHDFLLYVGAEGLPTAHPRVELIVFRRLEHLKVLLLKIATIPTTNRAACQRQVDSGRITRSGSILRERRAVTAGRAGACRVC